MSHVIAVTSAKGGTGKTTTALNLAVALAERGRPTVLVDTDPQGAVALAFGKEEWEWAGLYECITNKAEVNDVIVRTKLEGFSILARGRLDVVDLEGFGRGLASQGLERVTQALRGDHFDFVILDTPSGVGTVTRAALRVSDFALVPMQAEPLSLRSLSQILGVIEHVRETANANLQLLGILATMVRLDHEPSVNVMRTLWAELGGVLDTTIPRSDIFSTASERGLPVAYLAGTPPAEARRYETLAAECESLVADLTGSATPKEGHSDGDERPERQLF